MRSLIFFHQCLKRCLGHRSSFQYTRSRLTRCPCFWPIFYYVAPWIDDVDVLTGSDRHLSFILVQIFRKTCNNGLLLRSAPVQTRMSYDHAWETRRSSWVTRPTDDRCDSQFGFDVGIADALARSRERDGRREFRERWECPPDTAH